MSSLRYRSLVPVVLLLLSAAAVLALAAPARAAEPVFFAPYQVVPAGVQDPAVAVGDFNGDGKADLVTANQYGYDVSVLLGDGGGGFSAPTHVGPCYQPCNIATGDFNGDGKLDAVTADLVAGVSVLLGDGSGGLSAPTSFPVGTECYPRAVAVGDFNHDGNSDLVTANQGTVNVSILLGDGSGGFSAPISFDVASQPVSVAIGDFNGDGVTDLVTADQAHSASLPYDRVSVLLGNGDGTFAPCVDYAVGATNIGANPNWVAVADFNKDGKDDVVSGNWSWACHDFSILIGQGDGTFAPHVDYPVQTSMWGPWAGAVADFNGDGDLDLAGSIWSDPLTNVSILLGDGSGHFSTSTSFPVGSGVAGLAVGDFNGDGQPDIAGAYPGANSVAILLNTTVIADTSPPILTLPSDMTVQATGASGATVNFTATASDLVDGAVAVTCVPASGSTFPVGTTTVNCSATDLAGNTAHGSFSVTVVYKWTGFFSPVDNLPVLNVAKAGSAIPVKFSLSGTMGLAIFAFGYPKSGAIPDTGTGLQDLIEETVTAGVSGLTYDAAANQYIYVWKTDKAWAGTRRALEVKLIDGTSHFANFKFTK